MLSQLVFNMKEAHIVEFNKHFYFKTAIGRKLLFRSFIYYSGLMLFIFLIRSFSLHQKPLLTVIMVSIALVFAAIGTILTTLIQIKRASKAIQATSTEDLQVVLDVDNNGYTAKSTNFTRTYHWKNVPHIDETKNLILIYTAPLKATMIPKSAFQNKTELEDFIQACRNYWQLAR